MQQYHMQLSPDTMHPGRNSVRMGRSASLLFTTRDKYRQVAVEVLESRAIIYAYAVVIVVNVLLILEVLMVKEWQPAPWVFALEVLINAVFLLEIGVRVAAAESGQYFRSGANIADFAIASFCVVSLAAFLVYPLVFEGEEAVVSALRVARDVAQAVRIVGIIHTQRQLRRRQQTEPLRFDQSSDSMPHDPLFDDQSLV